MPHDLQHVAQSLSIVQYFCSRPWAKMVGMRHILTRSCFEIDLDAVWRVVSEQLPGLIRELELAVSNSPPP